MNEIKHLNMLQNLRFNLANINFINKKDKNEMIKCLLKLKQLKNV